MLHIASKFKKGSNKLTKKEFVFIKAKKDFIDRFLIYSGYDYGGPMKKKNKLNFLAHITDPKGDFFVSKIKPLIGESNNNNKLDTKIDKAIKAKLHTKDMFKNSPDTDIKIIIEVLNAYFTKFLGNPDNSEDIQRKLEAKSTRKMNELYNQNTNNHREREKLRKKQSNAVIKIQKKFREYLNTKKREINTRSRSGSGSGSRSRSRSSSNPRSRSRSGSNPRSRSRSGSNPRSRSQSGSSPRSSSRSGSGLRSRSRSQSGSGSKNSSRTKKKKNST